MKWFERIGLYSCTFFGLCGIGFILPLLPLYLHDRGYSNSAIAWISTIAALTALFQFPLGKWSDRRGHRVPLLLLLCTVLSISALLLPILPNGVLFLIVAVLFAENGLCRSALDSLAGAHAAQTANPDRIGTELGWLRFWRPTGIVLVALLSSFLARSESIEIILWPIALLQSLAIIGCLIMLWSTRSSNRNEAPTFSNCSGTKSSTPKTSLLDDYPSLKNPATNNHYLSTEKSPEWPGKDQGFYLLLVAMVIFHIANSPPGVYLGLSLQQDLKTPKHYLPLLFIVSMVSWAIAVPLVGKLSDRIGRKPLLIAGWIFMTIRTASLGLATEFWQILVFQILDGFAQGIYAVATAAWMSDRFGAGKRSGEAMVWVGTALVAGSALGPFLAGIIVQDLGYRFLFLVLAGIGSFATVLVTQVPESLTFSENRASSIKQNEIEKSALL